MQIVRLSEDEIRAAFPAISTVEFMTAGGFKSVYRVTLNGQIEAFKVVCISLPEDMENREDYERETLARVLREIKVLGNCHCPELVKLGSIAPARMAIGGRDTVTYSEEFIDGQSLRDVIRQGVTPDEFDVRSLLASLLKAIHELWSLGIVHRDLKPDNVMRSERNDRRFVLLDLGIAFSVHDTAVTFNAQDRFPPGTLNYLAPEMLHANFRESLDYRSDVYTAALTTFEYATGHHPLRRGGDDVMVTLSRIAREPPKHMSEFRNDLSPFLTDTVDQMLKKMPALRPANLTALISKLEERV